MRYSLKQPVLATELLYLPFLYLTSHGGYFQLSLANQTERPRGLVGHIFSISQGARYAPDVCDRASFGDSWGLSSLILHCSHCLSRGRVRDVEAVPRFHSGQLAPHQTFPITIIYYCIHWRNAYLTSLIIPISLPIFAICTLAIPPFHYPHHTQRCALS